jgi:hypothetical protein
MRRSDLLQYDEDKQYCVACLKGQEAPKTLPPRSSCFLLKERCCDADILQLWYSTILAGITWYHFWHGSKKVSQSGIMIPIWYHSQPGYSESTRDTNDRKPGDDTKNPKKPLRKNVPKTEILLWRLRKIDFLSFNFGVDTEHAYKWDAVITISGLVVASSLSL